MEEIGKFYERFLYRVDEYFSIVCERLSIWCTAGILEKSTTEDENNREQLRLVPQPQPVIGVTLKTDQL